MGSVGTLKELVAHCSAVAESGATEELGVVGVGTSCPKP